LPNISTIVQKQHKFLSRTRENLTNKTPSATGPIVSLIPIHNHQTAASLLSLPLSGVLISAHINKIDDHRNGESHTQHTSKQKGKLV